MEPLAAPDQMLAALLYGRFGLGGGPRLPSCSWWRLSQPSSWKMQAAVAAGREERSGERHLQTARDRAGAERERALVCEISASTSSWNLTWCSRNTVCKLGCRDASSLVSLRRELSRKERAPPSLLRGFTSPFSNRAFIPRTTLFREIITLQTPC